MADKKLESYLYYEEKNPDLKIYHGDCLEVMHLLPKVDLVVTDPPYGCDKKLYGDSSNTRSNLTKAFDYPLIHGDDKPFEPSIVLNIDSLNYALFGANYYWDKLPPTQCFLVWDKRDGITSNDQSDCELIYTILKRLLGYLVIGGME